MADILAMVEIETEAFKDTDISRYSLRADDPATKQMSRDALEKQITSDPQSYIFVAEEVPCSTSSSTSSAVSAGPIIVGWSHWIHFTTSVPHKTFKASDFPPDGDGEFAASVFQAHRDATVRIMGKEVYWHLSHLNVASSAQRRGIGAKLLTWGVEMADEAREPAYLNSTIVGKTLYERFGFQVIDQTSFKYGGVSYHMRRNVGRPK